MCTEVTCLLIGIFKFQGAICPDPFCLCYGAGDVGMVAESVSQSSSRAMGWLVWNSVQHHRGPVSLQTIGAIFDVCEKRLFVRNPTVENR